MRVLTLNCCCRAACVPTRALPCSAITGTDLNVKEHILEPDNKTISKTPLAHRILLGGVFGDSPGIKKLAHWLSHAAYLGCGYCFVRGQKAGGMYFKGYLEPTSYGWFAVGEFGRDGAQHMGTLKAFCGDPDTHVDDAGQRARANKVEGTTQDGGEPRDPSDMGCNGWSPFVKQLKYTDYNNLFVVPIAHAGLCGVVKDFWGMVLGTPKKGERAPWYLMPAWARRVVADREKECVATLDFGRRYSDITTKKGNWVMEDWLHWTEAWSVVLLRPHGGQQLLDERLVKMWASLRKGLLYFCRSSPTPGVATDATAAAAALKQYGALVEQHLDINMLKFNLHLIVCRLAAQEAARGRVCHTTEYWVENLIQWAKSTVRYRTTKYPELVLAHDILVDWAIAVRIAAVPGLRDVVENWKPTHLGYNFSNPDEEGPDGTQLLGVGRVVQGAKKQEVLAAVKQYLQVWQVEGWSEAMVEGAQLYWHSYANVRGLELLHSTAYTKARNRESFNVLCQCFEGQDAAQLSSYIARVSYFVRVVPPTELGSGVGLPTLRLAIADLFKVQDVDWGCGTVYHSAAYPNTPTWSACAVGFDAAFMRDKHAMARTQAEGAWFMPYSNMSGAGQE